MCCFVVIVFDFFKLVIGLKGVFVWIVGVLVGLFGIVIGVVIMVLMCVFDLLLLRNVNIMMSVEVSNDEISLEV